MSIQFPNFIGRDKELQKIHLQVNAWGKTVVINLSGSGGIGKTAILNQVRGQYKNTPKTLTTDVIDFSQTIHRDDSWIMEQVRLINPKKFPVYDKKLDALQAATDSLSRLRYEQEIKEAFIEDYNKLAQNHRIILLFDTIERIQDSPLLSFILDLVKALENTVLFLAGRYNDGNDFLLELRRFFPNSRMTLIKLKGFNEKEAQQYFDETDANRIKNIHPDLKKNIHLLSDGKPIKIALALDWIDRGFPLTPEVIELDPQVLEAKPQDELLALQQRFEYALMEGIRRFQTPVDEIILYMAHFNKRFNRKLIEFFFLEGLNPAEKTEKTMAILEEIKDLPFVKYTSADYFVLHDEMARLVQTHVWDTVEDPDRSLRTTLSEKIIDYYEQETSELPIWKDCTERQKVIYRSFEVESLYYRLYANFRTGFTYFEELFEKLAEEKRSGLAALGLSFVKEFQTEYADLHILNAFINGYYTGGIQIARQRVEEAVQILVKGKEELEESVAQTNWEKANPLDWYLKERMYLVYQQLGFCYRSLGEWEDAEINYKKSLELAQEVADKVFQLPGNSSKKSALAEHIAETLNNLSNVYRLTGKMFEARLLCQTSIMLRKAWQLDRVNSRYVMAMILWEMGDTAESVHYLKAAEKECSDEFRLALIKKYHSYVLFRTGLFEEALPLLSESQRIFTQKNILSELADALNIRSRIFRYRPQLIQEKMTTRRMLRYIEKIGQEANQLAVKSGDKYRMAECYLTQALYYYQWSKKEPQKFAVRQQAALKQWENGVELARDKYHQIYSLYCRLRGDIAFDSETPNYELAFEQYFEQCKIATRFKQAAYERAIDHLGSRLRQLSKQEPQSALHFAGAIRQKWESDDKLSTQFTDLVYELNEVQKSIEETEKIKELEKGFDLAMLSGDLDAAAKLNEEILRTSSLYTDERLANILLEKSRVASRRENYSEARRLANVALQIGKDLGNLLLIGNANLVLTAILWDTTSTAEAAEHLEAARIAFDTVNNIEGLAHVERFESYILYRTGIFTGLLTKLEQTASLFEKLGKTADLADVKNIMSRVARTDPDRPNNDLAHRYGDEALAKAKEANDSYRIAESYLSLAILSQREEKYDKVIEYCHTGIGYLPAEAHAIRSVYEGIRGSANLQLGYKADHENKSYYWDKAFSAFSQELIESAMSKPASLVRSTGLLFEFILGLPAMEYVNKYTSQIEASVDLAAQNSPRVSHSVHSIKRMLDHAIVYYPYYQIGFARKDA